MSSRAGRSTGAAFEQWDRDGMKREPRPASDSSSIVQSSTRATPLHDRKAQTQSPRDLGALIEAMEFHEYVAPL